MTGGIVVVLGGTGRIAAGMSEALLMFLMKRINSKGFVMLVWLTWSPS